MPDFLMNVLPETLRVFYEGSFYVLLGFVIAGMLHEFLPKRLIARLLGTENPRSVVAAALFGAPIPLCSCGVLPAAAALRHKGAGRSATLSFLISTPETGVDSIALTYGLLGGVMAVIRPVVAVVTAVIAGFISLLIPEDASGAPEQLETSHSHHGHDDDLIGEGARGGPLKVRMKRAMRYGFGTLLDDLGFWLAAGFLLTGVLSAALPEDFFATTLGLGSGVLPMLLMILLGVPLYLCASASTPVAAMLVAKGLSPGAALVFLLVGPATNAATLAVVGHLMGARRLRIYLGSIIVVSLAAGLLVDALAADVVRAATTSALGSMEPEIFGPIKSASAIALIILLIRSGMRTRFADARRDVLVQLKRVWTLAQGLELRTLTRPPVLGTLAVLTLLALLPTGVLVVEPGHVGIVQRFGRVVRSDLGPGLHLHWPAPVGRGFSVDVERVRQVNVGSGGEVASRASGVVEDPTFYLTADENVIDVTAVVHYRVSDPARFALGLEQSDALVRSAARRDLVRIAAATPIDRLYTTDRRATEQALREAVSADVEELGVGIDIVDARLVNVHAPPSVHDAFRDVASSLEERTREIHVGNAYATETTVNATGEAAELRARARADAVRVSELARGSTEAFSALASAHRRSPSATETRLYLETLERALAAPKKYVHGAAGSGGEVDLWIGGAAARPVELAAPESVAVPGERRNP